MDMITIILAAGSLVAGLVAGFLIGGSRLNRGANRDRDNLIPLADLTDFLLGRAACGELIDVKVLAHVMLAQRKLKELDLL